MPTDIVIAGLSVAGFDALKAMKVARVAPLGELFTALVKKPGYPRHQAAWYQQQMHDRVVKLPEDTPVSLTIAYVDYQEASTAAFVEAFKPFVLARPIRPITAEFDAVPSPAEIRTYQDYLAAEAKELRNRSSRIGEFTHIRNLSPFLLPDRNFNSRHHRLMMAALYSNLGTVGDVGKFMRKAASNFERHHPKVKAPTSLHSCYSDKQLFFCSPGGDRHGYFRHDAKGHQPTCVLAARSRFGGSFAHDLHYDCQPVTGLAATYPNCHNQQTPSKATYVNMCPNDYII